MGRRLGWDKGEGEMERGNLKVEMERRATGRGRREGGKGEGEKKGQAEGEFYGWMQWNAWVDMCYRIELQANRPGANAAMAFTDSYKHM